MYFEILDFLTEQKKTDPTRWFTTKEIGIALQRETDFSYNCIRRHLRRMRKNNVVYWDNLIIDPDVKASYFKRMYVYKSK